MKKIAIIGTNGIPARYGGFETLAEHLVENLADKYDFTVYCSSIYKKYERKKKFKKAKLIYLPFRANGWQSFIYDFFSYVHALVYSQTIILLGPTPSGIITIINYLFKRNLIVNHGGLNEWEREKYNSFERKWARINHFVAARMANQNIADNSILQNSLKKSFGVESVVIRYGGDHVNYTKISDKISLKNKFLEEDYYLCVARAQVDNNLHLLIDTFKELVSQKLVIISNWNVSEYGRKLKETNSNWPNIILLDAIYDINKLNYLRKNCFVYIHSHSYCGTAPSLVEAMNLNIPIICFDVPTNRETTHNKSRYFKTKEGLKTLVNSLKKNEREEIKFSLYKIGQKNYTWKIVCEQYLKIF